MSLEAQDHAWGQLVQADATNAKPILIQSLDFVLGRANDCDHQITSNKLVSAHHCIISKDDDGNVWLVDTSTNGTLLNDDTKLSKDEKQRLQDGDKISLVFCKHKTDLNVTFTYQDLTEPSSCARVLDNTLDYCDIDVSDEKADEKREQEEVKLDVTQPLRKKQKLPAVDNLTTEPSDNVQKMETTLAGCSSTRVNNATPKQIVAKDEEGDSRDAMEESLLCNICQDILHDCISLQPCMHSFCAGCYSEWMPRSQDCPTCRLKVQRISKNHIVNNLVEAYIKSHPDKKRDDEDLKELDAKNKITQDMLYPKKSKKGRRGTPDDSDEDYDEEDDIYSDSFSDDYNSDEGSDPLYVPFGMRIVQAAITRCRQCQSPGIATTCTANSGATLPVAVRPHRMMLARNIRVLRLVTISSVLFATDA